MQLTITSCANAWSAPTKTAAATAQALKTNARVIFLAPEDTKSPVTSARLRARCLAPRAARQQPGAQRQQHRGAARLGHLRHEVAEVRNVRRTREHLVEEPRRQQRR